MKLIIALCLVGVAVAARPAVRATIAADDTKAEFMAWATANGKEYVNFNSALLGADHEFNTRFANYAAMKAEVEAHNAKGLSWTRSMTGPYVDMTPAEFKEKILTLEVGFDWAKDLAPFTHGEVEADIESDAELDWSTKGAVTPIKNQGQCGSCWAFSTTGTVEGANFLTNGKLVSLAEEQLVQCDKQQDQGCEGGLMMNACQYIMQNGGIDTEADYPYTAKDGQCDKTKEGADVVQVSACNAVPPNDGKALFKAVTKTPVSVAIDAQDIMTYSGGVYDGACGTQLDHGVLVVGYGTDSDSKKKFWKVKNSWGDSWGEAGYFRLARSQGAAGECGINMAAMYATGK